MDSVDIVMGITFVGIFTLIGYQMYVDRPYSCKYCGKWNS